MRLARQTLLLAALTIAGAPAHAAEANPHLERGVKLLNDMEDAKALKELRHALTWPGASSAERAKVHVYIGIAQVNLLNLSAAKKSFRDALALDATAALPALTSPKIKDLFAEVRTELGIKPPPEPTPPPPETEPASREVVPPPPPPPRPRRSTVNWPAWVTLGAAVAVGATGLALGVSARSENEAAGDLKLTYSQAQEHHDAAAGRALGANICFGLTGALAITSGVLFYVGWKREKSTTTAAVVPLPQGGAVLQVRGATW
jgi:hypothetical protein